MKNLSAQSIVEKIKRKEISSREATRYFIDKIEAVNPKINAVVVKRFDLALKEADAADQKLAADGATNIGRLHGLPFTIKECLDLVGTPSTVGLVRRKNDFPQSTDPYVAKLQAEGAIVLGKTNVPQMCSSYESENAVYGTTNNPHNLAYTAGGSSGGEAAIIAAGGSPVGVGTDIGGSLRCPAAFCGISSIKPTMGRIVDHTRYLDYESKLAIESVAGVLGNYVCDLELLLGIMNEQAMFERPQVPALGKTAEVDLAKLKVGYFLSDNLFEPMPAVKRVLLETVEKLKSQGANVFECEPPSLATAEQLFFKILSADNAFIFNDQLKGDKPLPQVANLLRLAKMPPALRNFLASAASLAGQKTMNRIINSIGGTGAAFHQKLAADLETYRLNFAGWMERNELDAILSPPCALPAFLHRTADKVGLGGIYLAMYNVLGYPAGIMTVSTVKPDEAVPRKAGFDIAMRTAARIEAKSAGLPLAVQFAAKPWQEHIVLALIQGIYDS